MKAISITLWVLNLLVIVLLVTTNMHYRAEVDEAYKQGAADVAALYKKPSKEDQELLALQWWTDSKDMKSVRNKLCTSKFNSK